jgi:hypothetical protein
MAGYRYEKRCDCTPLAWVADAYQERVKLGKDGAGLALKFGINALYGKFAQRIGAHPYQNPIWAGLITAITRAKLNDAIVSAGQQNVIMIATDAVFVIGGKPPIDIDAKRLGAWSAKTYPKLFIVRPGLYWAPGKLKSRGISPKFFTVINEDGSTHDVRDDFEHAWKDYARHAPDMLYGAGRSGAVLGVATFGEIARPPIVTVNVDVFVGLRLAYRRGDLQSACQWQSVPRKQSFDWRAKRGNNAEWQGMQAVLWPKGGSPTATSHAYHSASVEGQGLPEGAEQWEVDRMLFEAMPDADMYLVNEP